MATKFRFDAVAHAYFLDEQRVPSITQMIEAAGLVETDYYTEEAARRGTEVHNLAAAFDLAALHPHEYHGKYRGWMLAHMAAMAVVKPTWSHVEQPFVHGQLRYGGRPDRVGRIYGQQSIVELKSGAPEKCHGVQTALQAILVSAESGIALPPEMFQRFVLYLKPNGTFRLLLQQDRSDLDEARRVIKRWAPELAAQCA